MQRHERHDREPEKPDPKDTRAKWLLLAIAVLLGMITTRVLDRLFF
jgi:hypothetical protein